MAAQFQLTMRSGPNPGKVFSLEAAEITVGRDTSNGIAINDAEISRKHAKLTLQGNAYALEDLGSTNGTFVNGTRLSGAFTLKTGDTVSFGENIVLLYEAASDPNATMASPAKPAKSPMAPLPPAAAPAAPAPVPSYSGQVPAGPAPVPAAGKKSGAGRVVIIVIAIILVCLILACVVLFLWVDADKTGARWCMFPFRFIAQLVGGVCP